MTPDTHCLLSLIAPHDIAERIEDILLAHEELSTGFTSIDAYGHGTHLPLQSMAEQVLGHSPRKHIEVIASHASLQILLQSIKTALPQSNIYYWITPVIEKGRL